MNIREEQMRAIVVKGLATRADARRRGSTATPEPGEVLIKVAAAA